MQQKSDGFATTFTYGGMATVLGRLRPSTTVVPALLKNTPEGLQGQIEIYGNATQPYKSDTIKVEENGNITFETITPLERLNTYVSVPTDIAAYYQEQQLIGTEQFRNVLYSLWARYKLINTSNCIVNNLQRHQNCKWFINKYLQRELFQDSYNEYLEFMDLQHENLSAEQVSQFQKKNSRYTADQMRWMLKFITLQLGMQYLSKDTYNTRKADYDSSVTHESPDFMWSTRKKEDEIEIPFVDRYAGSYSKSDRQEQHLWIHYFLNSLTTYYMFYLHSHVSKTMKDLTEETILRDKNKVEKTAEFLRNYIEHYYNTLYIHTRLYDIQPAMLSTIQSFQRVAHNWLHDYGSLYTQPAFLLQGHALMLNCVNNVNQYLIPSVQTANAGLTCHFVLPYVVHRLVDPITRYELTLQFFKTLKIESTNLKKKKTQYLPEFKHSGDLVYVFGNFAAFLEGARCVRVGNTSTYRITQGWNCIPVPKHEEFLKGMFKMSHVNISEDYNWTVELDHDRGYKIVIRLPEKMPRIRDWHPFVSAINVGIKKQFLNYESNHDQTSQRSKKLSDHNQTSQRLKKLCLFLFDRDALKKDLVQDEGLYELSAVSTRPNDDIISGIWGFWNTADRNSMEEAIAQRKQFQTSTDSLRKLKEELRAQEENMSIRRITDYYELYNKLKQLETEPPNAFDSVRITQLKRKMTKYENDKSRHNTDKLEHENDKLRVDLETQKQTAKKTLGEVLQFSKVAKLYVPVTKKLQKEWEFPDRKYVTLQIEVGDDVINTQMQCNFDEEIDYRIKEFEKKYMHESDIGKHSKLSDEIDALLERIQPDDPLYDVYRTQLKVLGKKLQNHNMSLSHNMNEHPRDARFFQKILAYKHLFEAEQLMQAKRQNASNRFDIVRNVLRQPTDEAGGAPSESADEPDTSESLGDRSGTNEMNKDLETARESLINLVSQDDNQINRLQQQMQDDNSESFDNTKFILQTQQMDELQTWIDNLKETSEEAENKGSFGALWERDALIDFFVEPLNQPNLDTETFTNEISEYIDNQWPSIKTAENFIDFKSNFSGKVLTLVCNSNTQKNEVKETCEFKTLLRGIYVYVAARLLDRLFYETLHKKDYTYDKALTTGLEPFVRQNGQSVSLWDYFYNEHFKDICTWVLLSDYPFVSSMCDETVSNALMNYVRFLKLECIVQQDNIRSKALGLNLKAENMTSEVERTILVNKLTHLNHFQNFSTCLNEYEKIIQHNALVNLIKNLTDIREIEEFQAGYDEENAFDAFQLIETHESKEIKIRLMQFIKLKIQLQDMPIQPRATKTKLSHIEKRVQEVQERYRELHIATFNAIKIRSEMTLEDRGELKDEMGIKDEKELLTYILYVDTHCSGALWIFERDNQMFVDVPDVYFPGSDDVDKEVVIDHITFDVEKTLKKLKSYTENKKWIKACEEKFNTAKINSIYWTDVYKTVCDIIVNTK
jgi:hypothetical protein